VVKAPRPPSRRMFSMKRFSADQQRVVLLLAAILAALFFYRYF
jgi:hypothetical protein